MALLSFELVTQASGELQIAVVLRKIAAGIQHGVKIRREGVIEAEGGIQGQIVVVFGDGSGGLNKMSEL